MMTEDNSKSNNLTLFFKNEYAALFDKLYMSIQTRPIGDTGEVVSFEQLNTQMQCDF